MRSFRLFFSTILLTMALGAAAADFVKDGNSVTVRLQSPAKDGARVVRLQVVNDNIIRVQATSAAQLPQKPQSLMVVPQKAKPQFTVSQEDTKEAIDVQIGT